MYTYPYQIIKNKLKANVLEIKDLDWFINQYSKSDKSAMLYTLPGVYVQFLPMDTDQIGMQTQIAECEFDIHLVTSNLFDKGEQRIRKAEATDHAMIMDKIYKTLNGKKGTMAEVDNPGADNYIILNSMTRTRVTPPHELASNMVSIQRFKTVIFDYSANKIFQKLMPDLEVNSE